MKRKITSRGLLVAIISLISVPCVLQADTWQISPNPNPSNNTLWVDRAGAVNKVPFTNNGDLFIVYGYSLDNSSTLNNNSAIENYGTLNNNSGGIININPQSVIYNNGILNNNSGAALNISYDFENSHYVYNNSGATITLDNMSLLKVKDGGVSNLGTLTVQNMSHISIDPGGWLQNIGTLNIKSDSEVTNHGTLTVHGLGTININSFDVSNFGTFDIQGKVTGSGSIYNYDGGTVNVTNTAQVTPGIYHQFGGKTVVDGTMSPGYFLIDSGTVGGNGTIAVANTAYYGNTRFGAGATIAPGDSIGKLTINSDVRSSGSFDFEIGGIGTSDVLDINGNLLLTGGTFEFDFINNFHASAGDYWDFLHANSITGWDTLAFKFDGLDAGLGWEFDSIGGGERLLITQSQGTQSQVPEPSSLSFLGVGLGVIGLAAWRRRK